MSDAELQLAEAIFADLQAATGECARRGEIAHARLLASAVILIGALQASAQAASIPAAPPPPPPPLPEPKQPRKRSRSKRG